MYLYEGGYKCTFPEACASAALGGNLVCLQVIFFFFISINYIIIMINDSIYTNMAVSGMLPHVKTQHQWDTWIA
jgi:hypothetical protein